MKIIVLAGGTSPEREISLRSGKQITKGLRNLGHTVVPLDPALGLSQPKTEDELFAFDKNQTGISNNNYIHLIESKILDDSDIVFIALHGKYGEDGTVQSLLELRGKKYTGSGVLPSAIAIDKAKTKILMRHWGVRTPDWILIKKNHFDLKNLTSEIVEKLGTKIIVKPNDQGSTIGFSIVDNFDKLGAALDLAFLYSDYAIIESYIKGKELTSTILGNEVLPTIEIRPKHELYDYDCKYTHGMSEYLCPAPIPKEIDEIIKKKALDAYNACNCSVFARVDFLLNENNIPYCLEVNTIPGMTNLSLVPMAAKEYGYSFEQLVERIIDLSLND